MLDPKTEMSAIVQQQLQQRPYMEQAVYVNDLEDEVVLNYGKSEHKLTKQRVTELFSSFMAASIQIQLQN